METTLVVARPTSMAEAIEHHNALTEMRQQLLVEGIDYGVVPGTTKPDGTVKPTLLKPGAEKLCTRFGLAPTFDVVEAIRDFTGAEHGGEPLFFYEIKCRLSYQGQPVAEGVGSCNSWEKKYRFRQGERICPQCSKAAIIVGKPEYGGGYVCFTKKGGCGAKFKKGDPSIEEQATGQVPNADIFDLVNTVRKMADKRSLVAAVLIATGASEFFTQDVEDLAIIDVSPWQPQPEQARPALAQASVANAELDPQGIQPLDEQQAKLRLLRVRLKERGGKPRLLSQQQVREMGPFELKQEIERTEMALQLIDQEVLDAEPA